MKQTKSPLAVLIKNADVYAPKHLGICDILICSGKITAIGNNLEVTIPGLQIIEANGRKVIPGIVDEHVHVTGGGGESGFSSRVRDLTMDQLVSAGVTTVIGVLGTDSITRNLQSLLAKVKALKEEGMSAWCLTGAYAIDGPTITGTVKDDVCFIEEILGVKLAINDHRCSMPTVEELIRLAANVRLASLTADKPGVIHMHTGKGKNGFKLIFEALERSDIPIRHFRPTHCGNSLQDAIRLGQMGAYIDFTASEDSEKTASDILAAGAGMPFDHITLSSDSGGSMPIWDENKVMIGMGVGTPDTLLPVIRCLSEKHGVPFEEALKLVTQNPADSLQLSQKGRLVEGADADLVFVDDKFRVMETYCLGNRVY